MNRQATNTHSEGRRERAREGAAAGFVSEVFVSLQGEGLFVGQPQVFVRLSGCDEECAWCDTLYGKVRSPRCVVHDESGIVLANPVSVAGIVDAAVAAVIAAGGVARTVSLTGGEPLEQPAFARVLARRFRRRGFAVYLETNGYHADAFDSIADRVDVVSMDVKLPSAAGHESFRRHEPFLRSVERWLSAAPSARKAFAKVVVDEASEPSEVASAARLLAGRRERIPLVIQPESGALFGADTGRSNRFARHLKACARSASAVFGDIRVIPQCHKILNLR